MWTDLASKCNFNFRLFVKNLADGIMAKSPMP
jgi:hypothetical protein